MATYVFDEFVFDDIRYALTRAGKPIKADTQVLEMLAYLLKNPGRLACSSLHSYGPVSRTLAQLAQLLGEPERAAAHFERALLDSERYGLNPQLALARLQYADLLRELGGEARLSQARHLAQGARSLAETLSMQPLAAASRQLLETLA